MARGTAVRPDGHLMADEHLARSAPADDRRVRDQVTQLAAAARRLVDAGGHGGHAGVCTGGPCPIARGSDRRTCDLAHQLAALVPAVPTTRTHLGPAWDGFVAALAAAAEAVGACRRTAHPHGECWFTTEPAGDGCATVLQSAHLLG